jgi:tetratricopeptide (TPR) repeat protein
MYEKAIEGFLEILRRQEYLPAMTNAANIYFLQENYGTALDLYNRALKQNSENRAALLGVARCNHELENYGFVKQTYDKIQKVDPELAERYAYLDMKGEEASRASDAAGLKNTVLWEDEE